MTPRVNDGHRRTIARKLQEGHAVHLEKRADPSQAVPHVCVDVLLWKGDKRGRKVEQELLEPHTMPVCLRGLPSPGDVANGQQQLERSSDATGGDVHLARKLLAGHSETAPDRPGADVAHFGASLAPVV